MKYFKSKFRSNNNDNKNVDNNIQLNYYLKASGVSSLLGNFLFFFSLPFSASSFFDNEMIFPFRPSQPSRGDASEIKAGFGFSSALLWGAIFGAFGLAPLPLTTTKNPGLFSFFVPVRMDPSPSSGWEDPHQRQLFGQK